GLEDQQTQHLLVEPVEGMAARIVDDAGQIRPEPLAEGQADLALDPQDAHGPPVAELVAGGGVEKDHVGPGCPVRPCLEQAAGEVQPRYSRRLAAEVAVLAAPKTAPISPSTALAEPSGLSVT